MPGSPSSQQAVGGIEPPEGIGIAAEVGVVGLGQAPVGALDRRRRRAGFQTEQGQGLGTGIR